MTELHPDKEHVQRVRKEMREAGATRYLYLKQEGRYLPKIIHPDETIGGLVYGRFDGSSAMLVATNRRVLFLDRKPGFTNTEELTYDVVAGVTYNKQGSWAKVTLHTRLGNFSIKFVNITSAERFTKYIEDRRLEAPNGKAQTTKKTSAVRSSAVLDELAIRFLKTHDTGVLSTLDKTGRVHGAVVYYVSSDDGAVYFTTKSETQKASDSRTVGTVAFTVFDADKLQTIQMEGQAVVETDQTIKDWVFSSIIKPRLTTTGQKLPPVTQIKEGAYVVIKIATEWAAFRDYGK